MSDKCMGTPLCPSQALHACGPRCVVHVHPASSILCCQAVDCCSPATLCNTKEQSLYASVAAPPSLMTAWLCPPCTFMLPAPLLWHHDLPDHSVRRWLSIGSRDDSACRSAQNAWLQWLYLQGCPGMASVLLTSCAIPSASLAAG